VHLFSVKVVIFDLGKVTMSHIIATTPTEIKRYKLLNQHAMPVRAKALHFINVPSTCTALYNLVKSFLSDKHKSRVSIFKIKKNLAKNGFLRFGVFVCYPQSVRIFRNLLEHSEAFYNFLEHVKTF
jgi:hypothetical protein